MCRINGCEDICNNNVADCNTIPDFTYGGNTEAIAACNDAYQIGCQAETLTKTITDALLTDYTMTGNTGQFMTNDHGNGHNCQTREKLRHSYCH